MPIDFKRNFAKLKRKFISDLKDERYEPLITFAVR